MKHTYKVTGMTCGACVSRVKEELGKVEGVKNVEVSLKDKSATVEMKNHISTEALDEQLAENTHYRIEGEIESPEAPASDPVALGNEEQKSKWQTYKPLILIFVFLLISATAGTFDGQTIDLRNWMHAFMAGFFITFSFFKFLDLRGFADSYATYDVLASRVRGYGYVYPFLELALGLAYLAGIFLTEVYIATIILMAFGSIGVIQAVFSKNTIRCACLGVVFNLPMSTVTIIENGLMVAMATAMLMMG